MPVDWEYLSREMDSIIDSSAIKTDERLASRISSLTRMTDSEIQELFPQPTDIKKLTELMEIVKSSENRNNKISKIVANSNKFAGVILSLLDKYV